MSQYTIDDVVALLRLINDRVTDLFLRQEALRMFLETQGLARADLDTRIAALRDHWDATSRTTLTRLAQDAADARIRQLLESAEGPPS